MSLFQKSVTNHLLIIGMLRKGEGTYTVDPETDELIFLGDTHPDQYHENNPTHEQEFDLPKNARYGDRAAQGEWGEGHFGEHVFTDIYDREHRHGIDAVIAKVADRIGDPSGETARQMIQDAIDDYNDDHVDSKNQGLPDLMSPEWRKLTKSEFASPQTMDEANNFAARGKKGTLINLNLSRDASLGSKGVKLAQHPESYRIPFAPYLHDNIKALRGDKYRAQFDEGITHGYISGKYISPSTRRLRGVAGQNLAEDLTLPHDFREELGHSSTSSSNMTHQDVHNWEVIQNMPKALFNMVMGAKGGAPVKTVSHRNYLSSLSEQILNNTPEELLDEPIYGTTLREAFKLGNADKVLLPLVQQMAKSKGALGFMIGNPKQAGVANSMVDTIRQELLEHRDLEGQGAELLQNARKRVSAGKTHGSYGSKKGGGLHEVGAEMLALSGLIGDPAHLANFSNDLFQADETAEEQHKLYKLMGGALTAAHGGQVRNHAPVSGGEMPGLVPKYLEGHMDVNRQMPEHMQANYVSPAMTQEYDSSVPEPEYKPIEETNPKELQPKPEVAPPPKDDFSGVDNKWRDALSRRIQQEPSIGIPAYQQSIGGPSIDPTNLSAEQLQALQQRVKQFGAAQSPYQTKLTDSFPVATSFDTLSIEDRLVKAMERVQILEAKKDVAILKQVPKESLNISKEDDVSFLAMKLGITKQDVKVISNTKGDWDRIAKAYRIKPSVVKVVKVTLGGA